MKDIDNINELIARCFAGECLSALEENRLNEWISANREEFKKLSGMISKIDTSTRSIDVDTDRAWQRVNGNIKKNHFLSRKLLIVSALAASFLIILGVAFWKKLDRSETLYYKNTAQKTLEVVLPDSTQVTLYPNALLTYQAKRDKGERNAKLTGKAFFNVRKNAARPFVVQAAAIRVEVLGTSFLVDAAYAQPSVFVRNGTVRVSTNTQKLILTRNQLANLTHDKTLERDTITDVSLFHRGNSPIMLNYSNASIPEVIAEIEQTYDLVIELKGDYEGNLITTSFKNSKPEDIIKELAYLCNGNYEKKSEQKYILYVKKSRRE